MTGTDTIAWLLEDDNPSSRYLALRTLLDRPADDPDVSQARASIPSRGPARRILAAQWPEGHWMHPGRGHSPRYRATMWQIIFLAALGAPLSDEVARACNHVLDHGRLPDGRFSAYKRVRGAFPCLNGSLLRALLQLGFQDSRVSQSLQAMTGAVTRDSFRCHRNVTSTLPTPMQEGLPCAWGAIKVLSALVEVQPASCSPAMQAAIEAGVKLLTDADLVAVRHPGGPEPSFLWLRFGFPLADTSDLLEALDVLGRLGVKQQPKIEAALDIVRSKRDPNGRCLLEHSPTNTWASFGKVGHANKWVTWRVLNVLKQWQQ